MLLKTQMRRGRLALALITGLFAAQTLAPPAPAPLDRIETAVRGIAVLAQECSGQLGDNAAVAGAAWLLTSTPLDLPAQRKSRQVGCRRA